jgi:glycosyltransferase involved in cell wall biosynthesis
MKIAVVNNCVPFVSGGAEHLANALVQKLNEYGHKALLVRIPFQWRTPEAIVEQMLACRCIRIDNVDRVIGLKFPAYYIPHDDKVLWLLHQFRQAYDLWGTPYQEIPSNAEGERIRNVIIESDNRWLRECRKICTISPVASERLKKFNGIDSTVVFHPLLRSDHFRCEDFGDYVFYPSRITGGKRQLLAVESMKHVKSALRLVIAGSPETPADLQRIEASIRQHGLQDRVELLPRFISEEEKAHLLAKSLACVYTPYDEDSYGYVTLEAYHSRKPVLTCTDSGGTRILVEHEVTGYVAAPEPRAMAEALDRLFLDRRKTILMGQMGYDRMMSLKITWDHVIGSLTS